MWYLQFVTSPALIHVVKGPEAQGGGPRFVIQGSINIGPEKLSASFQRTSSVRPFYSSFHSCPTSTRRV